MRPKYDIEELIGLRTKRPKRYYERFHSGSLIFSKKHLNKGNFHIRKFVKENMPNIVGCDSNSIRHVLIEALCCESKKTFSDFLVVTQAIIKLGEVTGWYVYDQHVRRLYKLQVNEIVTMGDYEFFSAIEEVCKTAGLCKDLTHLIYKMSI